MTTLTIQLPDDTAGRLEDVARSRGLSVDQLLAELGHQALADWEAETRFRAMAAEADKAAALAVLDRLDDSASSA